jgi:transposase
MPQRIEQRRRRRGDAQGEPNRGVLESLIIVSYRQMPGLSLHLDQAARWFGLRGTTCQIVLEDLVRRGRLRRAEDGQYRSAS